MRHKWPWKANYVEEPTKHRARAGEKAGEKEDGLPNMPKTRRRRYA